MANIVDAHGPTALYLAAGKGNFEGCQKLYEAMSDEAIVLQVKNRKQTVLHRAVQCGEYEVVQLLLSKDEAAKKLLEKIDEYEQSALHWAISGSTDVHEKIADLLIQKAIRLLPEQGKSFFLIKKREGYTALHIGVHKNSKSIDTLLKASKDSIPRFASEIDNYGQTALHWAVGNGNTRITESLCKAMTSEDINIQTRNNQQTALHFAVANGYTEVVRLLIESGANPDLKDTNGLSALDWAEKVLTSDSKEDIINLLRPCSETT